MSEALHNSDRAHHALDAINGYGTPNQRFHVERQLHELTEDDRELVDQWARDLLGDLRHLCDAIGADMDTWNERAFTYYAEERDEEEQQRAAAISTESIHAALRAAGGLDVETWNTGGGCMVTYAIIARLGSVVRLQGEPHPAGVREATEYVGITHEDEWVLCYTNDTLCEGEEFEIPHTIKAYDVEGMARFVKNLVVMHQTFSITRLLNYRGRVGA